MEFTLAALDNYICVNLRFRPVLLLENERKPTYETKPFNMVKACLTWPAFSAYVFTYFILAYMLAYVTFQFMLICNLSVFLPYFVMLTKPLKGTPCPIVTP